MQACRHTHHMTLTERTVIFEKELCHVYMNGYVISLNNVIKYSLTQHFMI